MACGHDPLASFTPSREQASARHDALSLFRIYGADELGPDGYPFAWHDLHNSTLRWGIKDTVREQADNRCERCHHRYVIGGVSTWVEDRGERLLVTPCDELCTHGPPWFQENFGVTVAVDPSGGALYAPWRVLTVHHLNGVKADCRWWNLAALCQRCHLTVQGRVVMDRAFILEHSEWFKPHAAGFYADKYLGEQLSREETLDRQDELLGLERLA